MVAYLDEGGARHLIAKIRDTFWPVGTILATTNTTSPASYLGGSWEAYASGRTLVGADDNDTDFTLNKQGGAKTVDVGSSTDLATGIRFNNQGGIHVDWGSNNAHGAIELNYGFEVLTKGGVDWNSKANGQGVKVYGNLPLMNPYVAVNYWRRVA